MKFKVICQYCNCEEFEPYKGRCLCSQCGEILESRDDFLIVVADEE